MRWICCWHSVVFEHERRPIMTSFLMLSPSMVPYRSSVGDAAGGEPAIGEVQVGMVSLSPTSRTYFSTNSGVELYQFSIAARIELHERPTMSVNTFEQR